MIKIKHIILILCACIILYNCKFLFDYFHTSQQNKDAYKEITDIGFPARDDSEEMTDAEGIETEDETENETQEEEPLDYASLLAVNSECIGWIRIDGIGIDYPIVQGENNDYYLYRNFNKDFAICGTIFMDYRNDIDLSKEHLLLYGHQMKDGSMFKQLNGYKDKEFYEEHPEITLYLREQKYTYDVAAVYVTNAAKSGDYYNYLHSNTRKEQIYLFT